MLRRPEVEIVRLHWYYGVGNAWGFKCTVLVVHELLPYVYGLAGIVSPFKRSSVFSEDGVLLRYAEQ